MIPVLYYNELEYKLLQKDFSKVLNQLVSGDFKSADVRKMTSTGYYRARLNSKDRLLVTFIIYNSKKHLLLLELIADHNYAKSRFLRGAQLPPEENMQLVSRIEDVVADDFTDLHYVNEKENRIHILNKIISFDESQNAILNLHPPLIIIGSAGSGKTVLVLEKLKQLKGNAAYISLSGHLVENARKMYFADGYDNGENETEFLSFKQFIESWRIPEGKEIQYKIFEQWFNRHAQHVKMTEPYRLYEEFKGVLTGSPVESAWLSKQQYLTLGIKQSIFPADKREEVYSLFTKYLHWMKENNYYDSNILSFEFLSLVKPRYDYIMIDEVQDITNIQLKCIMQSLNHKNHFILTGDSNQIVHPNFFSWSKIKTYLYHQQSESKHLSILQTNYRNSIEVVKLSNTLLKIKNLRFGSIDKESNYLVNTVSKQQGEVILLPDEEKVKSELNRRTQNSTLYAVIVTDAHVKEEARKHFKTPLIFSVHEAKGLEYENVILLNFVSSNPKEFGEIVSGLDVDDLRQDTLQYARPADKSDKDAEIYKFYINSLYVAITRAVKNIYIFEKQIGHIALELLSLKESKRPLQVKDQHSNRQEWLDEASRLEEQGKYEQAEQIRAKYLGYEYLSQQQLEEIKALALDPSKKEGEVKKERKQLFHYAQSHFKTEWIDQLAKLQFPRAMLYMKELKQDGKEYSKNCRLGRQEAIAPIVKKYGPDFIPPDTGLTGLMLSLYHGQDGVTDYLLKQNAVIKTRVGNGMLPLDYLLQGYFKNIIYHQGFMATKQTLLKYWFAVKPDSLTFQVYDQRLTVGSHSMLFFLVICMRCIEKDIQQKATVKYKDDIKPSINVGLFDMNEIMKFIECMPDEILPPYRKKRQYVNSILALHELDRKDVSCKMLFQRIERGSYIINPQVVFVDYSEK